jgi:copper chaperone CopZ
MRHLRPAGTAAILTLLVFAAACARHAPESRITSIEARIDGLTCPTCVPPLKASLTRTYGKSEIAVDDDKDTATIRFAASEGFSAPEFQAAVERVNMRVVTVRMQACGTVKAAEGGKWLAVGDSRFLVRSDREVPTDRALCLDGTLDSRSSPATFQVSAFAPQGASGS